jgi:hypothetical protein
VLTAKVLKGIAEPDACNQLDRRYSDGFFVAIDVIEREEESILLQLTHETHDRLDIVEYLVHAVSTPLNFGGHRWWFICPRTGRRVAKLYLPLDGLVFASRGAYGLHYRSQREARADRLMSRARRLHARVGGDGLALGQSAWSLPPKPAGQWWRTREAQVVRWQAADDAACAAWVAMVTKSRQR